MFGNKPKNDLAGRVFGRLTAIKIHHDPSANRVMWLCRCKCGKEKIIRRDSLISENTLSCGCRHSETSRENIRKSQGRPLAVAKPHPATFGEWLVSCRVRKKLPYKKVARLIGVSDKTILDLQNDRRKPTIDECRRLAMVLEVDLEELITKLTTGD